MNLSARRFLQLALITNCVALVAAMVAGRLEGDPGLYFGEHRFLTWLSAAQLVLCSLMCATVFAARSRQEGRWSRLVWLLVALGFLFLAIDEVAMIHERMDRAVHRLLDLEETGLSDRLDDAIVALYGVIGIVVLVRSRRVLRPFASALPYLMLGFAIFFLMTGLDMLTNRPDVIRDVALFETLVFTEDVAKLCAECAFLAACQGCLLIARRAVKRAASDRARDRQLAG